MEFIVEYAVEDEVCDGLMTLYDEVAATGKACRKGSVGSHNEVDESYKKCTDLFFNDIPKAGIEYHPRFKDMEYLAHLKECSEHYSKKYLFGREIVFHSHPKFQYYKPGEAFYGAHFDASGPEQLRVVAWITYLNTVTDGGGTHFTYQNHTVEARKGKTVLFPPGYTHLHHGVVSPTQEKYIVTGWFAWNMK